MRRQTQAVAQRLDDELRDERFSFIDTCQLDREELPRPDLPMTVSLDGGYVHRHCRGAAMAARCACRSRPGNSTSVPSADTERLWSGSTVDSSLLLVVSLDSQRSPVPPTRHRKYAADYSEGRKDSSYPRKPRRADTIKDNPQDKHDMLGTTRLW